MKVAGVSAGINYEFTTKAKKLGEIVARGYRAKMPRAQRKMFFISPNLACLASLGE
jgi:hypothetical protein